MKKNIIAMAVAAAVAAPVAAMADTTLYGKVHMSYDVYTGDNNGDSDASLSSNSSRLGIKGKEGISDNLSLIYQYETAVGMTDRRANNKGSLFSGARNTFVGFTGDWGTAIAGMHDTPFKKVGRKYDLFGDAIGDSRSLISSKDGVSPGWDLRTDNTVAYATPNMGGFQATLAYVSDHGYGSDVDTDDVFGDDPQLITPAFDITQDGLGSTDNNNFDAFSISAGYEVAGFMIDGAYEQHNIGIADGVNPSAVGMTDSESAYRLGAGYKMGGFKLVALWQQTDDASFISGGERTTYGLGGAYTTGKHTFKAQWYKADEFEVGQTFADAAELDSNKLDDGADLWAVGYDYKLSKQTTVYAQYAATDNDTNGTFAVGGGGHGDSYPEDENNFAGGESGAFSLGVVHKF